MTIKRKLLTSNILMFVIPLLAYVVFALLASLFLYILYKTNNLPAFLPAMTSVISEYSIYIAIIWIFLYLALVLIVFITTRVLTGKMYKTIITPLDVLSKAAQEIENNNLHYRIEYNEVDEFKNVCNAFNKMSGQLNRMLSERKQTEESRRELIAGLSHDLRTPITAIKVHVEGLKIGVAVSPQQQQKYLSIIENKTNDMEHIINRLVLFSKLDMEDFPMNLQFMDINKAISKIASDLSDEYVKKSLKISYIGMEEPVSVMIDNILLQNVVINILENSVQYSNKENTELSIQTKTFNDVVEIILADNGPGVLPEKLPQLFDVFFRADPARNTKGSGLGLAISAKIIRRMNGAIHAETAENGGLSIIIQFPIVKNGTA